MDVEMKRPRESLGDDNDGAANGDEPSAAMGDAEGMEAATEEGEGDEAVAPSTSYTKMSERAK